MAAVYPTSLKTYTTKQNHIDVYEADHINDIQTEVVALQTYLGTNPHGDRGSLSDRMNALSSGSGGFYPTNADFVGANTYPGRHWYRTDTETLKVVKSDGTIQSIGGSFSNALFEYQGMDTDFTNVGGAVAGEYTGSSIRPTTVATIPDCGLRFLVVNGQVERTIFQTKFYKITGINNIKIFFRGWGSLTGSYKHKFDIGGVIATGYFTSSAPQWHILDFDVNGLANATDYNVIGSLQGSVGLNQSASYISRIMAIGL